MKKKTLIASTVNAANKILIVDSINLFGSISIVGLVTTESVAIQIPRVESPDVATDAHWTNFVSGGVTSVLNVSNNRISLSSRGTYRIAKPASGGNAFGICFE